MSCLDGFFPARGLVFIRKIETEETYAGSPIVIPDPARDKVAQCQFLVVSVGDYEWCDDPEDCPRIHHRGVMHKHRLCVGDWVLLRKRSWMASPDPDLYIARQVDVLGVFQEGV